MANLNDELRLAVEVLFGVSGFLLFRPYASAWARSRQPPRLADYLQRRVLRIIPGYWFALTVGALAFGAPIVNGAFSSHWWLLYGFGQAYSLSHNADGLPVAWTLSVEASFYLFLPLFAVAVERLGRRIGWRRAVSIGLLALFLLGTAVRVLNVTLQDPTALTVVEQITYGLPGELPYLVMGMALAALTVHCDTTRRTPPGVAQLRAHPARAWALAALCYLVGASFGSYLRPVGVPGVGIFGFGTRFILNGLLEAAFVAAVLLPAAFPASSRRLPTRILSWRALAFVGMVSYGLYLWHLPLADWLALHTALGHVRSWGVFGWLAQGAAMLCAGLVAGIASYYLVELPFLRRKRGWRRGAVRDETYSVKAPLLMRSRSG